MIEKIVEQKLDPIVKQTIDVSRGWKNLRDVGAEKRLKEEEIIIKQTYTPPETMVEYEIVPKFRIPKVIVKGRHPLSVVKDLFYPEIKRLDATERYKGKDGYEVYQEKLNDPIFKIEFEVTNRSNKKKWIIKIVGNDWFAERIL